MFPEGTRSRTGELLPFKKGGFIMAIKGGAPMVPVAINALRRPAMPKSEVKQSLLVTSFAPLKRDLHMMPYGAGRTRLVKRLLKLVYGRGR